MDFIIWGKVSGERYKLSSFYIKIVKKIILLGC